MGNGNADWMTGPETVQDAVAEMTRYLLTVERGMLVAVHDVAGAYQGADVKDVKLDIKVESKRRKPETDMLAFCIGYLTGRGADGVREAVEHLYGNGPEMVIVDRYDEMCRTGIDDGMFFDGCAGNDELADALGMQYRDVDSLREYVRMCDAAMSAHADGSVPAMLTVDRVKLFA